MWTHNSWNFTDTNFFFYDSKLIQMISQVLLTENASAGSVLAELDTSDEFLMQHDVG